MRPPSKLRRLEALIGAGAMALTVTSCTSSTRSPSSRPAQDRACAITAAPAGPVTIPLKVAGSSPGTTGLLTAPVCVDGQGPFPFLVDTGQAVSVISPTLADRLHLHRSGKVSLGAVSCQADTPAAAVASWSVGGLPLDTQHLAVAPVPDTELAQAPQGVLGSDVLGRFDAIRVGYRNDQLTMVAPEAALPAQPTLVRGATRPVSAELVSGTPTAVVPLVVVQSAAGTLASAPVTLGRGHPTPFVVDSGSPTSSVGTSVARFAHLAAAGTFGPAPGVGCPPSSAEVHSGPWAVGSLELPSMPLVRASDVTIAGQVIAGTVGTDVLARYGSFVLDYRSAQLILGGR
jgi:hypothetical protein